ncbi:MAG: 50S ribosomal protein L20 [Bacteroidales bacterium]
MPKSVNAVASRTKRKKILKQTRGYYGAKKNVWSVAKNAYEKSLTYAYRDRRAKKRTFRSLWIQRINAAARQYDLSYSQFMGMLQNKNIQINRKVLADLAMNDPKAFDAIVKIVKK